VLGCVVWKEPDVSEELLLDLPFDPEDGGYMLFEIVWSSPEDSSNHSHCRDNLKSGKAKKVLGKFCVPQSE
jgi:hypothetical protein